MNLDSDAIRGRAEEFFAKAKEKLGPADEWVRSAVHARPLVALAGALGLGYLVGRLLRR